MRALAPVPASLPEFDWFNALRDRVLGVPKAKASTFATLPAVPEQGMLATVTNSNTAVRGAVVAGGGANIVLAHYDGTNWRVV